jgi:hypothetical protein
MREMVVIADDHAARWPVPAEVPVLRMIALGHSNAEIAGELFALDHHLLEE